MIEETNWKGTLYYDAECDNCRILFDTTKYLSKEDLVKRMKEKGWLITMADKCFCEYCKKK